VSYKLDVNGSVNSSGTVSASGNARISGSLSVGQNLTTSSSYSVALGSSTVSIDYGFAQGLRSRVLEYLLKTQSTKITFSQCRLTIAAVTLLPCPAVQT
jgi:hypothetical protein